MGSMNYLFITAAVLVTYGLLVITWAPSLPIPSNEVQAIQSQLGLTRLINELTDEVHQLRSVIESKSNEQQLQQQQQQLQQLQQQQQQQQQQQLVKQQSRSDIRSPLANQKSLASSNVIPLEDSMQHSAWSTSLKPIITWRDSIQQHASVAAKEFKKAIEENRGQTSDQWASDCVLIDIGANVCTFSKYLLDNTPCSVWAFEPVPAHASFCVISLASYGERFRLFPVALCESPTKLPLFIDQSDNLGWNTFIPTPETPTYSIDVLCLPLDGIVRQPDIGRLYGIKIDTEGAEFMVLAGMHKIILQKPIPLFVEIAWGPKGNNNWGKVVEQVEWLFENGYQRTQYSYTTTADVIFLPKE